MSIRSNEFWRSDQPARDQFPCRSCSECRGLQHHWLIECPDPSDLGEMATHPAVLAGHLTFYICKHCDAWTLDAECRAEGGGRD